ncbi:MAG: lipoate--protein ligase family protein [Acidimicrobiia bacterium]
MPRFTLVTDSYPDHPAMDVAVSHSTLAAVASGALPDGVLRLHVPSRVVAFGRADRVQTGYPEAVNAARAHGFAAVERLAGGRAAVFHRSTIAFAWAIPDGNPRSGIERRFRSVSSIMIDAFGMLGIDARIGQIPGEYCPGQWSVNVAGRVKVMGVGQRLVRGGAHVGGVVVVDDGASIREVLIPVYRALRLDWDPRTSGSLADRSPGLDTHKVMEAIIEAFSANFDLSHGSLPSSVISRARGLIEDHLPEVA